MAEQSIPNSVTRGFMSYRRADNDSFRNVVDRIRSDIMAMYEAKTGKQLDIFLDRETIGWGEDWRQKIHESAESATVFIPVLTMRYFTSTMCMEELQTFHAAAERLGVTELILPVVLFGAEQIRDDDPRAEVRLVARLNHKNIQEAWTAGYDSPEWLAIIAECVRDLDSAIQKAESILLAEQSSDPTASIDSAKDGPRIPEEFLGDFTEMTSKVEAVEPLTERALRAMSEVGEAAGDAFNGLDQMSASGQRARMIAAARTMSAPSQELREAGEELEITLFELDSQVRALVAELSAIDLPIVQEQLGVLLDAFEIEDLPAAQAQVAELIQMLKFVSLMNVSLRNSLRPAVRGLGSIQTAIGIFLGWQQLRGEVQ